MNPNLNKIKNLIVKRALQQRYRDFMFWYNDEKHTDHSEKYGDHSDESSYQRDHVDYSAYSESFLHNDSSAVYHSDYLSGTFQDPNYHDMFPHSDSY